MFDRCFSGGKRVLAAAQTTAAASQSRRGNSFLLVIHPSENGTRDVNAAGAGLGKSARDAGAVADGENILTVCFEFVCQDDAGTVKLDLDAVEQCVIVCHTRCDVIERLDHFDDIVEMAFRQDEGEIARCRRECRMRETCREAVRIRTASFHEIAVTLDDDTAAEHVRK